MNDASFKIMEKIEKTHWWFRVRCELLLRLVRKYFKNNKDLQILDIGCGTGYVSKILAPLGVVFSIDPSEMALQVCKNQGLKNLYLGNVDKLPFPDNYFDLVVALDVLEHVKDDKQAVNEIHRVLKFQGILICFVPAFKSLWSEQDEVLMHYRRYNQHLLNLLFDNEWECLKMSYFNFFLFPFIFFIRKFKKLLRLKQKKDEIEQVSFLNPLFYWIFKREIFFLSCWRFPFGVSLLAVYKKLIK